jgi:PII-like signaling protein
MRVLDGEQVLVRIYVGESDKWGMQSLYLALVERLRREGFAGATVFHGVCGFGARSAAHRQHPAVVGGSAGRDRDRRHL